MILFLVIKFRKVLFAEPRATLNGLPSHKQNDTVTYFKRSINDATDEI